MNACKKGKAGEREAAHYINALFPGLNMRRGAQHAGNADAPDIKGFPGVHWEVKRAEKLNIHSAVAQAKRDAEGKAVPVVLHRRNRGKWLVTLEGDNLCAFAKAVILANEDGLASSAGQEADKAVGRTESKPIANRKTVAIEDCGTCRFCVLPEPGVMLCSKYKNRTWEGISCAAWKPNANPRKGWTAEDIERDIQAFKQLGVVLLGCDAQDTDRQEEPKPGIGDDPWFGKHDMRDCENEVDQ